MKHASLFSGIGGFDLAAQWMGWENVFNCEWDKFCQQILKHYWPNAKSYGDIDQTDFTVWKGRIDVLSGGFPCQPYSTAGKRKGKEDNRHKWPQMLRAIREISPRWIVGENVRGLTNWNGGLVFDEVQVDLEDQGYQVIPFLLPACGVDAPHRRDRIWFVAYSDDFQRDSQRQKRQQCQPGRKACSVLERTISKTITTDTGLFRQKKSKKQATGIKQCDKKDAPNPEQPGRERSNVVEKSIRLKQGAWDSWPTVEPSIRGRNDGVPTKLAGITFSKHRNESIKGYGNAVVPQLVLQIYKAINEFELAIKK